MQIAKRNKIHTIGDFSFEAYMPLVTDESLVSITLERKGGYTLVKCEYAALYLTFETDEMLCQPSLTEDAISYTIDYSKIRNATIESKEK